MTLIGKMLLFRPLSLTLSPKEKGDKAVHLMRFVPFSHSTSPSPREREPTVNDRRELIRESLPEAGRVEIKKHINK